MKFFKRVAKQALRSNRFEYFCFLVYLASEAWVGALVKKAFSEYRKIQVNKVHVTSRCSTSRFAPWTVFKSHFCGSLRSLYRKNTT